MPHAPSANQRLAYAERGAFWVILMEAPCHDCPRHYGVSLPYLNAAYDTKRWRPAKWARYDQFTRAGKVAERQTGTAPRIATKSLDLP